MVSNHLCERKYDDLRIIDLDNKNFKLCFGDLNDHKVR